MSDGFFRLCRGGFRLGLTGDVTEQSVVTDGVKSGDWVSWHFIPSIYPVSCVQKKDKIISDL